jgi:hypothetical protein
VACQAIHSPVVCTNSFYNFVLMYLLLSEPTSRAIAIAIESNNQIFPGKMVQSWADISRYFSKNVNQANNELHGR